MNIKATDTALVTFRNPVEEQVWVSGFITSIPVKDINPTLMADTFVLEYRKRLDNTNPAFGVPFGSQEVN